jgi:hypothetical protein
MTDTIKNEVSADDLLHAMNRAFYERLFHDEGRMTAASDSAGFITTVGGQKFQVFVAVHRYSDELLASDPDTGGLLSEVAAPGAEKGSDG